MTLFRKYAINQYLMCLPPEFTIFVWESVLFDVIQSVPLLVTFFLTCLDLGTVSSETPFDHPFFFF